MNHSKKRSSLFLLACTLFALLWSNSPWVQSYEAVWNFRIAGLSLRQWLNEGGMTLFFFLVGLELKRELLWGELATAKKAILPVFGALGGMLFPGLIYSLFNWGSPAGAGWGIPMATDIAFALGALAFFGRSLPTSLRVFLTALAVLDDLGSILLIAFFYSSHTSILALGAAALVLFLIWTLQRKKADPSLPYLILCFALWLALDRAGVQPTLAGVIGAVGLSTESFKVKKLEKITEPWVTWGIVPLFAMANAGISITSGHTLSLNHPVCLGVLFGLALGKPIGILVSTFLSTSTGLAHLPREITWRQLTGVACLGGIGFTVSLFVSQLTFPEGTLLAEAKLGILLASLLACTSGWVLLRGPRKLLF